MVEARESHNVPASKIYSIDSQYIFCSIFLLLGVLHTLGGISYSLEEAGSCKLHGYLEFAECTLSIRKCGW